MNPVRQRIASRLEAFFLIAGRGVLRLVKNRLFDPGHVDTLPTAGDAFRGVLTSTRGGAGVSDKLFWDRKDTAEAQAFAQIPTLPDPGADRIVFWDDSAGDYAPLTPDSGDFVISGTTLSLDPALSNIADLADPNADRLLFWDDSESAIAHLTPDATDFAISTTTLALGSAPSFTDFTNANHDHGDADDGGQLTVAALSDFAVSGPATGDVLRWNGTDWVNADPHALSVVFNTVTFQLTNMPSAVTEFNGTVRRTRADLANCTEARLVVDVVTASSVAAPLVVAQYSTDESAWNDLGTSAVSVNIGSGGSGTTRNSGWVALAAGAKADVYLRLVTQDGNNASDPDVGLVVLYIR